MTESEYTIYTESDIVRIAENAKSRSTILEQTESVIDQVIAIGKGDRNEQRACVIHILNTHLGIGPYTEVIERIDQSFPLND